MVRLARKTASISPSRKRGDCHSAERIAHLTPQRDAKGHYLRWHWRSITKYRPRTETFQKKSATLLNLPTARCASSKAECREDVWPATGLDLQPQGPPLLHQVPKWLAAPGKRRTA